MTLATVIVVAIFAVAGIKVISDYALKRLEDFGILVCGMVSVMCASLIAGVYVEFICVGAFCLSRFVFSFFITAVVIDLIAIVVGILKADYEDARELPSKEEPDIIPIKVADPVDQWFYANQDEENKLDDPGKIIPINRDYSK